MGILSLTCSVLNSWDNISAADKETLNELLRKGVLTDDAGLKNILGELIRQHDLERGEGPLERGGEEQARPMILRSRLFPENWRCMILEPVFRE